MASFDGAYESLVQGVSEQVPSSRLPGQVTEQVNMVSDLVTGVRRRTGSKLRFTMQSEGLTNNLKAWKTDVGGISTECYLNTATGELIMLENGDVDKMTRFQSEYLKTTNIKNIRQAGVGDSLFILNTDKVPQSVVDTTNVKYRTTGFFELMGSALKQKFSVTVKDGTGTWIGEYTTPDGTETSHIDQTTTMYIATKLLESLKAKSGFNAAVKAVQQGSLVYLESLVGKDISITTSVGALYITHSKAGILDSVSQLPPSLPAEGNNSVIAVGSSGKDLTYFKYVSVDARWEETAKPGSPTGITEMPVEVYWDGDTWQMEERPFEGRLVGDEDTNPDPEFIGWGITGMASYQGRLVILSGSWVYLSATNKPRVFYRTTVTELLDSDAIGIGSSSASSASFQYGVVFNKDLVLFSPEHQALIPGLNQALTPRNAHILVTSTYTSDMSCEPVTLGSSLMYAMPRSSTHYGIMEMIPSSYTDSAYMSGDASEHIPRYLQGRCRFAVSSTVGGMVLFGSSVDPKVLYVHEYLWVGEEKALRSWHRWEFETPIAYAFFSGELINIVTVNPDSGHILVSNIDPKASDGSTIKASAYYIDNYTILDVKREGGKTTVTLPPCYTNYVKANNLQGKVTVAYYMGDLNSMPIGSEFIDDSTILLNGSTTASKVLVGIPFRSKLVPSPPVFKDYLDRPIVFNRVQLIKMYAMTDSTGIFTIEVRDRPRSYDEDYQVNPTKWLSTELNLGRLPVGGTLGVIIPTRVDANTAEISFISEGLDEMNIINLEYTCRSGTMRKRR